MAERDIIARLIVEGANQFVQETQKAATAEEQLNQAIKENTSVQDQNVKKTISARQELKNLREELIQLERQGKRNTAEYRNLELAAGQLDDAIGDVNARLKQSGSDTRGLDKALRAATVLTGGFTALQGATALFGKESENLQKSLLKVQGALAILNGLQEIQTELAKTDNIFTSALTKAKLAYAAAVGTATGATKAFRLALIATGLGAVIVLIGVLIANWDKLKTAIFGATDALEKYNKQKELEAKNNENFNKNADIRIQRLKNEAKLLEAQGKTEEANAKNRLALLEQIKVAEENQAFATKNLRDEQERQAKAIDATRVRVIDARGRLIKYKEATEENVNAIKNQFRPQLNQLTIAYNSSIAATEQAKIELELYGIEQAKTKDKTKKTTDEIKAQAGSIADLNNQITKLKQLQDASNDPQQIALYQARIDVLQVRIKILTDEVDRLRQATGRVSENAQGINPIITKVEQFKTEAQLAAEAYEKLPEAIKKANAELANNPPPPPNPLAKSPEQIKAEEERTRDFRIAAAQQTAAQVFAVFKQSQDAQQQILDNKLASGLISEEEYAKEVAEIRRKEAIAAKTQALFDIAINTAVAAINAFRNAKTFAGGVAFATIIAALGAAQAAIVAATPIPKFFKGVKNFMGGLAWVGDGGKREPITSSSGELLGVSPDKPTLVNLPKGANVYKDIPTFKKEANIAYLPTPSLALPTLKENKQLKSLERAMKKNGQSLEDVKLLLKQGNLNTRQGVNELKTINTRKKLHRV